MILSCEHAGNRIPDQWLHLFETAGDALETHRGYDPGTLELGNAMAEAIGASLHWTDVSRLLVDCNRSLGHPRLFSQWTRGLPKTDKTLILDRHYHPHRQRVIDDIETYHAALQVAIHIGVHSFTPIWEGEVRRVDVGLLYDPRRIEEQRFCRRWQRLLVQTDPALRVRCNQPYLGKADGLTTWLRRKYDASQYLGIELEVNQAIVSAGGSQWKRLRETLLETLQLVRRDAD